MRMITCSLTAIALLAGCAASSTPEVEYGPQAEAGAAPPQAQTQAMPVAYVPASRPTGRDTYNAEKLAKNRACAAQPLASLSDKGPGFETYSVPCSNGRSIAIRCEFGNCRVLQ
jgi:hypothetical protein